MTRLPSRLDAALSALERRFVKPDAFTHRTDDADGDIDCLERVLSAYVEHRARPAPDVSAVRELVEACEALDLCIERFARKDAMLTVPRTHADWQRIIRTAAAARAWLEANAAETSGTPPVSAKGAPSALPCTASVGAGSNPVPGATSHTAASRTAGSGNVGRVAHRESAVEAVDPPCPHMEVVGSIPTRPATSPPPPALHDGGSMYELCREAGDYDSPPKVLFSHKLPASPPAGAGAVERLCKAVVAYCHEESDASIDTGMVATARAEHAALEREHAKAKYELAQMQMYRGMELTRAKNEIARLRAAQGVSVEALELAVQDSSKRYDSILDDTPARRELALFRGGIRALIAQARAK